MNDKLILCDMLGCLCVCLSGVLHLTPVHAICRFKPSLSYIDSADQAALADSEAKREAHRFERLREGRMTEEEEMEMEEEQYLRVKEEENKKELQTVIMKVKKKEYGGGATAIGSAATGGAAGGIPAGGVLRKQSYAFLKQIEEREDWIPLKVHEPEVSTHAHAARCTHTTREACTQRIHMYPSSLCVPFLFVVPRPPPLRFSSTVSCRRLRPSRRRRFRSTCRRSTTSPTSTRLTCSRRTARTWR